MLARKRSKYGNLKTLGYASAKEAKRAQELQLLEKAGQIRFLRKQIKFKLIPKQGGERACYYISDFVYERLGNLYGQAVWGQVVEDVKGYRKGVAYQHFVTKRKLMLQVHGIAVQET